MLELIGQDRTGPLQKAAPVRLALCGFGRSPDSTAQRPSKSSYATLFIRTVLIAAFVMSLFGCATSDDHSVADIDDRGDTSRKVVAEALTTMYWNLPKWDPNPLPPASSLSPSVLASVTAAAVECGRGITAERWLAEVEWFGSLPRSGVIAELGSPLDPFWANAVFSGAERCPSFIVVGAEPLRCASPDGRIAITCTGEIVQLVDDTWHDETGVARSRVLSENGRAFLANDADEIRALLHHTDPVVRREAVLALVRSGDPAVGPELKSIVRDDDVRMRYYAALGCARLGDRSIEPQLRALLNDPELSHASEVDGLIYVALGRLGFTDVVPELKRMAASDNPFDLPIQARETLTRLGVIELDLSHTNDRTTE